MEKTGWVVTRTAFSLNTLLEPIHLLRIPGGCTALLQPMDVGVNKIFKDNVQRFHRERQRTEVVKDDIMQSLQTFTPALHCHFLSVSKLCLFWIFAGDSRSACRGTCSSSLFCTPCHLWETRSFNKQPRGNYCCSVLDHPSPYEDWWGL